VQRREQHSLMRFPKQCKARKDSDPITRITRNPTRTKPIQKTQSARRRAARTRRFPGAHALPLGVDRSQIFLKVSWRVQHMNLDDQF
jgi:hypothetical protein